LERAHDATGEQARLIVTRKDFVRVLDTDVAARRLARHAADYADPRSVPWLQEAAEIWARDFLQRKAKEADAAEATKAAEEPAEAANRPAGKEAPSEPMSEPIPEPMSEPMPPIPEPTSEPKPIEGASDPPIGPQDQDGPQVAFARRLMGQLYPDGRIPHRGVKGVSNASLHKRMRPLVAEMNKQRSGSDKLTVPSLKSIERARPPRLLQ
jgi:hypothetical protein